MNTAESLFAESSKLKVLVVAYYFPPMGLSGVQRVAKFCKYLHQFGWQPVVLSVEPKGYYAFDDSLMAEMEEAGVEIHRAESRDINRLFRKEQSVQMPSEEVRKRWAWFSHLFLLPDSKIGWKKNAVELGKKILAQGDFELIFSSAPPFTAHLIGAELSQISGLPFVADFREAWLDNSRVVYPTNYHKKRHLKLEKEVVESATRVVTINREIKKGLVQRHLGADGFNTVQIIPHGFDPEDFTEPVTPSNDGVMRFLYSGVFYDAQKPDTFLSALAHFLERRPDAKPKIQAQFVGLLSNSALDLVNKLNLASVVRYEGYLPHNEVVQKLQLADILWMTIGHQAHEDKLSTSKLYEYFGTRKPILGLVPEGDEAAALRGYGAAWVIDPDDVKAVSDAIEYYFDLWQKGKLPKPDAAFVEKYDRQLLTRDLAKLFSSLLVDV